MYGPGVLLRRGACRHPAALDISNIPDTAPHGNPQAANRPPTPMTFLNFPQDPWLWTQPKRLESESAPEADEEAEDEEFLSAKENQSGIIGTIASIFEHHFPALEGVAVAGHLSELFFSGAEAGNAGLSIGSVAASVGASLKLGR